MTLSPFVMFPMLLCCILIGAPVCFSLMGTALIFGLFNLGPPVVYQFVGKVNSVASNFDLVAVPLFVFMGTLLERSGIAERIMEAMHLWTRRIPGGLAVGTLLMCVVFAASTGVIGATETIIGLLATPIMLKYNYDKALISGVVCAGGSLATVIPPSIVAVVIGPLADVSIGDIFTGMFIPGLLLAAMYIIYALALCALRRECGPTIPREENEPPFGHKLLFTAKAMLPPALMIAAVLGSIMFGFAAPSEAAAVGSLCAALLSLFYRKLTWSVLKDSTQKTLRITSMIMMIILGGNMFTGVFLANGGGAAIEETLAALHFGPAATLSLILVCGFLAGFFLDWISVLLIFIPVFVPILSRMGLDRLWICILFMLVVQTSYLTPPMAPAIFYFRGIKPDSITTGHIMRGVVPFIVIQFLLIILIFIMPELALWLPRALE